MQKASAKFLSVPPLPMGHQVLHEIMCAIGSRRPETGGILLGPIETTAITAFFFDATAQCTDGTYTPDVNTLGRKMREEWLPSGLDLKGFVHSHPGSSDRLSQGDLVYIRRILEKNRDMPMFAAPIVIPREFRLQAIIVLREQPNVQRLTTLQLT